MLNQADRIFELIAGLQRGVDDDERWLTGLDGLSDALGRSAMFIGSTRRAGGAFELSGHRIDPQWIELVNGPLASREANPVFARVSEALRDDPARAAMRPFIISRLMPRAEFEASPIYRKAMKPAGYEHVMALVLEAGPASAISLTLVRRAEDGDFTERDARLSATIGPHLLVAMRLRYRFAVARSGAMLLDCIDRPLLLFSGEGGLVHANREGERLFAARDGLTYEHGHLHGASPTETRLVEQMIRECDRAARGVSLAPQGIARLPRPSGAPDLVLRAMPLAGSSSTSFGIGAVASVALIVHDPGHSTAPIERIVGDGLGISPAEAAVATRIWEGDSVGESAAALGLSPNTVKTHLKTIYERLGIKRQSALVRRIALLLASLSREEDR